MIKLAYTAQAEKAYNVVKNIFESGKRDANEWAKIEKVLGSDAKTKGWHELSDEHKSKLVDTYFHRNMNSQGNQAEGFHLLREEALAGGTGLHTRNAIVNAKGANGDESIRSYVKSRDGLNAAISSKQMDNLDRALTQNSNKNTFIAEETQKADRIRLNSINNSDGTTAAIDKAQTAYDKAVQSAKDRGARNYKLTAGQDEAISKAYERNNGLTTGATAKDNTVVVNKGVEQQQQKEETWKDIYTKNKDKAKNWVKDNKALSAGIGAGAVVGGGLLYANSGNRREEQ